MQSVFFMSFASTHNAHTHTQGGDRERERDGEGGIWREGEKERGREGAISLCFVGLCFVDWTVWYIVNSFYRGGK